MATLAIGLIAYYMISNRDIYGFAKNCTYCILQSIHQFTFLPKVLKTIFTYILIIML